MIPGTFQRSQLASQSLALITVLCIIITDISLSIQTLRKDRHSLFVPIKDNNAGKELSASTISRWICTTIVDSHAAIQNSRNLSGSVKAHEVRAVATSLQLFNKVDLLVHSVMKAGSWSSGGTFTSFYLRDLCPQADSLQRAGPILAAGDIIRISSS